MKKIYADYAAATPTDSQVVQAMSPFLAEHFGNPSSQHSYGRYASAAVEKSREEIASFLGAKKSEVYFTGSGTESNNLALLGIAKANKKLGRRIVTSTIEHPSIINACRVLEKDGWEVVYVNVTSNGLIDQKELERSVTDKTILVSIHLANSEIGVIQPIQELVEIVKARNPRALFHTDACQATSYLNLEVGTLGVDALTFNGSKAYGPKGVAVLYVREGIAIFPLIYGGGQERSLRSGTENVAAIVGLAKAVEIITDHIKADSQKASFLRNALEHHLGQLKQVHINVPTAPRLPNHLSVSFGGDVPTDLVAAMDKRGVAVSSGSACSSRSLVESHVLSAVGLPAERIHKTLRITLGRHTSETDVNSIVSAIQDIIYS